MKCSRCQFDNPAAMKFCGDCGHLLYPPAEAARRDLSFDEKIAKIQRYLPEGLTEKILSQRDRIEGERKQVTVMFCDMEGFTVLTERLGPEEVYAGMGRYHKQQGTVEQARKYLADALEIFERLGTLLEPDKVRKELAELPV